MTARLVEHLPTISTAPNGGKKLRELILQLAVMGKLVPQDSRDEPANEFVDRIRRSGQVFKKFTSISGKELPFSIPKTWTCVSFGEVIELISGQHLRPEEYSIVPGPGLIPYLTGPAEFGEVHPRPTRYTAEKRAVAKFGDILLTVKGAGVGKTNVVDQEHLAISRQLMSIRPVLMNGAFVAIVLKFLSEEFQRQSVGIAIPGISRDDVLVRAISVPPLAEQHRIVAKVDELMVLCDRLEAQHADAEAAHTLLVKTLLETLTQSRDAVDFAASWERIKENFDTLFTTEASVDVLKQTLLQLAVMGKLVPQDPNDEPASELLKRSLAQKVLVEQTKNGREEKALELQSSITTFLAPHSWSWARFADVVSISSGVTLGKKLDGKKTISMPYLRVANVQRGYLSLDDIKEVEILPEQEAKYLLLQDDLLLTEGGDWDKVGRTAIWQNEIAVCLHQNHIFKARKHLPEFNVKWAALYLNSPVARAYFESCSKQTTNLASINMTQLRSCPFPLPPLAEQHRIVAKLDELMALCDQLKADIQQVRQLQGQLSRVIIENAVNVDTAEEVPAAKQAAMATQ